MSVRRCSPPRRAGLAGIVPGARAIQGWLYGLAGLDPLTLGSVSFFLALVGCAACLLPSLRAMTVDAADVLKEE